MRSPGVFPGSATVCPLRSSKRYWNILWSFLHGQTRAASELKKKGIAISAGGVRSIWLRHELQVKSLRLNRLEQWAANNANILTESQVQALEVAKEEQQAHGEVESPHPGFLIAQDTYYVGYIKGVGKLYQQTGIDTHSNSGRRGSRIAE